MPSASAIIATESNQATLQKFFTGIASCDYYDGTSHQLYLDLDDNTLFISQEASDQSWKQRDDGSLIQVLQVSGYCDIPQDERYTDDCSLFDYGYEEWLEMIEQKIADALPGEPSIERQRDGRFNLYVPRRPGEPEDTRPYRGQFDSATEAMTYAHQKFGATVTLENVTPK